MGSEQNSKFYDYIYSESDKYKSHYLESIYLPIWKDVVSIIHQHKYRIIDLGCGTGQFAQLCFDENIKYEVGLDFSEEAIKRSKETNPFLLFKQTNLLSSTEKYSKECEYDAIVCLEVLEHIEKDHHVLNRCDKGKALILSVPNFDSEGHVRSFDNELQIRKRYEQLMDIDYIKRYPIGLRGKCIYLIIAQKT